MSRQPYDVFRDMLEVHREIGYLLTIAIALAIFDLALGTAIAIWPEEDTYLVPGADTAGTVGLDWGVLPPDLPAGSAKPNAPDAPMLPATLLQVETPEPSPAPSSAPSATNPSPATNATPEPAKHP